MPKKESDDTVNGGLGVDDVSIWQEISWSNIRPSEETLRSLNTFAHRLAQDALLTANRLFRNKTKASPSNRVGHQRTNEERAVEEMLVQAFLNGVAYGAEHAKTNNEVERNKNI